MANVLKVESVDSDGKAVSLVVKKPTQKHLNQAQLYCAKQFKLACEQGLCFRTKLEDYLIQQGKWSEETKVRLAELEKDLTSMTLSLKTKKDADGNVLKLSEGRKMAISMAQKRAEWVILRTKLKENDVFTVEGHVDNAKFDYLVSLCTFNDAGDRVFNTVDDYLDKSEEPYAYSAAEALSRLLYQQDDDWLKKLPENEFLINYKFVNQDLRYINKDGKLVNAGGHLVNQDGELIGENGELVDVDDKILSNEKIDFIDDVYTDVV